MAATQKARIVGNVEYRAGDGPLLSIPQGVVEVVATAQDVTLSWTDGEQHTSTSMPVSNFHRFVNEGAIQLDS